jgi:hypothetical protein
LGSVVWYGYSLLIPADTPRLPVHITVGQWWSPSLVFALRETNGELDFTVYTGSTTQRCKIGAALAPRGQWHRLVVRAAYGPGPTREIEAFLGDVQVCRWQGNAENGERLPVWKLGLYRPTIGKVPRPHPTQTVFFRDIRKGPARTDVQ